MEGAVSETFFFFPEDYLSISAIASYIGNIDDPDSFVDFVTQSTFESILTGPDFDLPAQQIKHLPMLLDPYESAPLQSRWSINAVHSYPEVVILDEDYDDDYDVTEEDRGTESLSSDPKVPTVGDFGVAGDHLVNVDLLEVDFSELEYSETSSSSGEDISIDGSGSEATSTDSTGSSNYSGEAEEVMRRKRRKLV